VTAAPHADGENGATEPLLDRDETAFPPPPGEREAMEARRAPHNNTPGPNEQNVWAWPPDPVNGTGNEVPPRPAYDGPPILIHTASNRLLRPAATRKSTGVFHSFPNSPNYASPVPLPGVEGGQTPQSGMTTEVPSDEEAGPDEFPAPATRTRRAPSWWKKFTKKVKGFWVAFNDFMTVPLWAALASLIVALIQPLQHTLDVHLPPIKNALEQAGKCSIPITLIVLGAYFYQPVDKDAEAAAKLTGTIRLPEATATAYASDEERLRANRQSQVSLVGSVKSMFKLDTFGHSREASTEAPEVHPGETRTVWVAVLSRMVITPLILLPGIAMSAYFDWHQVFDE
jgi:hypothetical protein